MEYLKHTSIEFSAIQRNKHMKAEQKSLSYPFPRPLLMSTNFSMPPLSAKALAFSMLRLVTSCSVQQTDATVSSDNTEGLLPGSRFTRSRMAYFPAGAAVNIQTGQNLQTSLLSEDGGTPAVPSAMKPSCLSLTDSGILITSPEILLRVPLVEFSFDFSSSRGPLRSSEIL